ncbi:MAG: hypothetical protein CND88_03320 [Candidatus Thioglobus sp. MED-G23]|nr:MAG: hypothetical protein CND88_03320 [Candidatus Thioglobus sp. MED-G23]
MESVEWRDLFAALSLVLILEGLIPFVTPSRYRRLVERLGATSSAHLRYGGLIMMAVGLAMLYLIRR